MTAQAVLLFKLRFNFLKNSVNAEIMKKRWIARFHLKLKLLVH
jgi:hypothetical protein